MRKARLKNWISLLMAVSIAFSMVATPVWAAESDDPETIAVEAVAMDDPEGETVYAEESSEEEPIAEDAPEETEDTFASEDPEGEEGIEQTAEEDAVSDPLADLPIDPETGDIDYDALTDEQLAALLAAQDGIMTMSVEDDWITAANDIIGDLTTDTWTTYLTSKFYEAAPFASDGSGTLNWSSVSLPAAQVWDGTAAGNPLPTVSGGQITFDGVSIYTYNGTGYASELEAQQAAAMADPGMISPLDGSKYYVYSPQQLLYAFQTLNDASNKTYCTVEIMRDLDMNGMNFRWPTGVSLEDYTTINGNGCTIYNLCMLSSDAYTAMISQCTALKATSLTFRNANICNQRTTAAHTAVFIARPFPSNQTALANYWNLDSISFKDCTVVSRSGETGTLFGRFQCSASVNTGATIQNCNVQNSLVTGLDHVGTLTGPILKFGTADKCFSVGCTNISYGEHSGGLFSCMGGMDRCSRCFVDAQVFGRRQTGVFTGNTNNITSFFDCYSSGFIEGQESLGGFNGSVDASGTTSYFNCYSTALVGLRSAGFGLGGFFGRATAGAQAFVNCYAAGEVGSADTISTGATPGATHQSSGSTPTADYVGGFAGQLRLPKDGSKPADNSVATVLAYCYYDKQTTAMREWDMGIYTLTIPTTRTSTTIAALSAAALGISNGAQGLRGVLTTDTEKSGKGITGTPTAGTGFTGFADLSSVYTDKGIEYAPGWDYSVANHYPELNCMANASAAEWGEEYYRLVQAYSKSSTSGAMLETWEKGLDEADGTMDGEGLDKTVYDTVRDLTLRFELTTEGDQQWHRTKTATGSIDTYAKVVILGEERNVLELTPPDPESELFNCYSADYFAPGLEWLETDVTVNGEKATRRLRVMPTAGLEAGKSATVIGDALYDHADDVEMYFSTASRMDAAAQAGISDITTGIFPDSSDATATVDVGNPPVSTIVNANPLTSRQVALMGGMSENDINALFNSGGTNGGNDDFSGVPVKNYMTKTGTDNATGSKLFVYGTKIASFNPENGQVINDSSDVINFTDPNTQVQYNGYQSFENVNARYLMEYVWELADGRVIRDAKIVQIKAVPFLVQMYVQHSDCQWNENDENSVKTFANGGLDKFKNDGTVDETYRGTADAEDVKIKIGDVPTTTDSDGIKWPQELNTDPLNGVTSTASHTQSNKEDPDRKYMYGYPAYTAWKLTEEAAKYKTVTALTLQMGNDEFGWATSTIRNPKDESVITISYTYYNFIRNTDGNYYTIPETVERSYRVKVKDGAYYLAFNKQDEVAESTLGNKITMDDVEDEIIVTLTVSEYLTVEKQVSGSLGDRAKPFSFTANLAGLTAGSEYTYYKVQDAAETPVTITVPEEKNIAFELKHGEHVVFPGLLYGTDYTITENNYQTDGYTTQITDPNVPLVAQTALTTGTAQLGLSCTDSSADPSTEHENLTLFKNIKDISAPTGITMRTLPFALLALLSMGGGALWIRTSMSNKRRRRRRV